MKATITSLIFLLLSLTVSSQTYKYIGIEEGLSNQKIYKIQKDARGYMWFLTHVGIDQYPAPRPPPARRARPCGGP